MIEAIADGSVPLETSCLSSTRTRSASCSILDLLDPSCTLSPFSITCYRIYSTLFARTCFFFFFLRCLSLSLVFRFSSFFFPRLIMIFFSFDFFFFFPFFFFLSPVTPQVKRRIRTESWPENCGFGGCVRVLLATLLSAATPKLLWPVIMRRRERQLLHADIFTIFSRINGYFILCSYNII